MNQLAQKSQCIQVAKDFFLFFSYAIFKISKSSLKHYDKTKGKKHIWASLSILSSLMKTTNQDSPPLLQKYLNFPFCFNLNFINITLTSKVIDFADTMSPDRKIFYWYFLIITSSLELKVNEELVGLNFYYWKAFLPLSETERFPSTYSEFAERTLTWGLNPQHPLCC